MRNNDFRGVSPSQLEAMSCRLAWHLGYRLGYRPRRLNKALDLGTGIHWALEQFYSKGADPVGVFQDWCSSRRGEIDPDWTDDLNAMVEIEDLGLRMLIGYVETYGHKPDMEVLATEHTIEERIPIPGKDQLSRYTLTARLDGIVRDPETGKLFSLEHKTYGRLSTSHFDLDHQFTAQVWLGGFLAKSLGVDEEIVGVIWNGLRKQSPGPRVSQSLFHREKIFRTEAQIQAMLHRAYWQCREMSGKNLPIFPQPNQIKCSGCNFREVCNEFQRGGDWQFILDEMFVSRAQREEAVNGKGS
jgi:hypothetical protein